MDSPFEVIDLKSGNVIAGFESEQDALASLHRALRTNGARASQALALMRITEEDQFVIAMGEDLENRVRSLARTVI